MAASVCQKPLLKPYRLIWSSNMSCICATDGQRELKKPDQIEKFIGWNGMGGMLSLEIDPSQRKKCGFVR